MSALIWLLIWELAAHFTASVLLLPSPHDTVKALFYLIGTSDFYLNLLSTGLRCVAGIMSSFFAGAVAAIIAFRSYYVREFFRIPVSFFKSIPVMAIVIYVILLAKSDTVSVVVCFLMCFPISYSNILTGLDNIRLEYVELAKTNGLSTAQIYRFVLLPMLRPQINSALSLITGVSWKVVVASEVLSIPKHSIGYEMMKSKYYLETPQLFAYMFVLIILSIAMENAVNLLLKTIEKRTKNQLTFGGKEESPGDIETIVFDKVCKSYTDIKVLNDYSERFETGITAVLGPSGIGKTTLARLISGLEEPDSGEITTVGGVSYLFQEDRLFPWLNVASNMMLGIINEKGMTREKAYLRVKEIAAMLEIEHVLEKMPSELSGGMAHRASLGRAIIRKSRLLILDEPLRGLDGTLKKKLIISLKDEILNSGGKPRIVVLITHEDEIADALADRKIRL